MHNLTVDNKLSGNFLQVMEYCNEKSRESEKKEREGEEG